MYLRLFLIIALISFKNVFAAAGVTYSSSGNFKDVVLGSSKTVTYTVTNNDNRQVRLEASWFSYNYVFKKTGGTCDFGNTSLYGGQNCTVDITFTPNSARNYTDRFSIGYFLGTSWRFRTARQALSGNGIEGEPLKPGKLEVFNVQTHGEVIVGQSKDITFIFENTGDEHVRIDSYWLSFGSEELNIVSTTCGVGGFVVDPSESCQYVIRYSPDSAIEMADIFNVGYFPGTGWDWQEAEIIMSGLGIEEPIVPPITLTGKLHVDGRYIKDEQGNIVVLRGVSIPDPEHLNTKPWERPNITAESVVANAVDNYHATVIRVPVLPGNPNYPNEGWFSDVNGREIYFASHLDPLVRYLTSRKIYVIVDLHYLADYTDKLPKVLEFWNFVAPRYKDNPYVIYEVYNEPIRPDDWNTWKNTIAQPAVDAIRGHAPENLIIVGGPYYDIHLAGAASNPISGTNIIYTAHIYNSQSPMEWEANYGELLTKHPIFVTEWGFEAGGMEGGTQSGYGEPLLNWMEQRNISWTMWSFDILWEPRMFEGDWVLTTGDGGMGDFVRDALLKNVQ